MNKIFKTKYHPATKTCIVCSELARRAGKVASIGIVLTGMIATAQATQKTYSATETIANETFEHTFDRSNGAATVTITGNGTDLTVTDSLSATAYANTNEPIALLIENGAKISAGNAVITLKTEPQKDSSGAWNSSASWFKGKGLIVRGNSDSVIGTLNADVIFRNTLSKVAEFPDSYASYGVVVGYDNNGGNNTDNTTLTIQNSGTINVSNTEDSISSVYEISRNVSLGLLGNISVSVKADVNHQLSGIRIIRTTGATPKFISNDELAINVTDKSVSDYITGIYLSGDGSSAELNGKTTITLKSVAEGKFSAGIKIGKPFDDITNGISVTANEALIVDTTGANNTAGVRLFGNKAKLTISNQTTEQSQIKASSSAIIYDTQDYSTTATVDPSIKNILGLSSDSSTASRNTSGDEQTVDLYNTELTTTSDTASLIKVNAETINSEVIEKLPEVLNHPLYSSIIPQDIKNEINKVINLFNNGTFYITNAKFNLSGSNSSAEAADKGWLIEVKAVDGGASSLDVTIDDNATIAGLVTKETSSDGTSATLNMALNNGAVWELKQKTDLATNEQRSTLNSLTIGTNSSLDAATNTGQYIIKLTSDGSTNNGTLTNNGKITLANKSYNDKLTIEGNYVGGTDSVLLINTEWNAPGDESGSNSKSDVLAITGTATGSTKVVAISTDTNGTEGVIDGNVQQVSTVINTIPVITVGTSGNETVFTGKAKTSGISEVQLAKRTNGSQDEYYWTAAAISSTPGTPSTPNTPTTPGTPTIIDPTVPGYVATSRVNMEQTLLTLSTFHERRGDNGYLHSNNKDQQSWVRVLAQDLKQNGESRFNLDSHLWGIQIGHDFLIRQGENGKHQQMGIYAAYTKANTDFTDNYRAVNGLIVADKFTGKANSEAFSLGASHTFYQEKHNYLDLVTQFSWLRNHYKPREGGSPKQNGWAWAVSAEYGHPIPLKDTQNNQTKLTLEPQAQIIYQYAYLNSFNDGVRSVAGNKQHSLRGRLGSRLVYHFDNNSTVYGLANFWLDFLNPTNIHIGSDKIRETYARAWAEFGIGTSLKLTENSFIYTDVRYQNQLGSQKLRGYRGNIGFSYTWK